jgi:hypothetical protein
METVRDAWTDERLDDLNHRVDEGFKEMRTEFRAVRSELGGQIAQLNRTILQLFGGMLATMVVGFLAILTQL